MNDTLLQEVLAALGEGLWRPVHFWSVVIILLALVCAWFASRAVRARVAARLSASGSSIVDALQFPYEGFRRLAFPISAWLLVWMGAIVLRWAGLVRHVSDARLLRLASILLGAMAVVRLTVYVVRRALPRVALIGAFEKTIAALVLLPVALHIVGWLDDVIAWMKIEALPIGSTTVTLWSLATGAITVLLAVLVALWIGAAVEAKLERTDSIDLNLRVVLARLLRAVLFVVALLVALSVAGIDLTLLTVFGGALGVGLGLGFQRIASNYVSGFIILLDRSLRIGDLIQVDKYNGVVAQIRTRYTVVRALDGTEAIIPNEMLVSSPVTNLSFTDKRVRLAVKVSVGYETDVPAALSLMEDAARQAQRVLTDPPPFAMLLGFSADGLDLEVGFWIADPEQGRGSVQSEVAQGILERFRAARISIPYPQRDVRITGWIAPQSPS